MVEKSHTAAGHETGFWPHVLDPLRNAGEKVANFFAPSADASSIDDVYEINVELPGVAGEDVDVELHDNVLVVKGEKRFEREETGKTYYFSERRFGSFHRSFRLPEDVDEEDIAADFVDGVLTIKIAKRSSKAPQPKKIEVRKN
ncbi:MAG: Hsp20/alpha crystallin family protein [Alphaproteobacteria bacterium]|jgi:HSP20 family protein|nr:Hsp20/alpha crystallin family protein [Alphaproteobacteria bacterium]